MTIKIKQDMLVECTDWKTEETYDKQLKKWEEIKVETIQVNRGTADIMLYSGNVLWNVPMDVFETV